MKQIGKVKKLEKQVPLELTDNQKNCHFELSSSLTVLNNNEPFLDQIVTCCKKWILYRQLVTTSSVLGPRRSSKALPKASLPQIKVLVSLVIAAHLIHCSFLSPGETVTSEKYAQQINEMHQKLPRLQLTLVSRMGPVLLCDKA